MTDLAKRLRTLQADADRLNAALTEARSRVDGTARAYDARRRYAPTGAETTAARTAWGLALREWCQLLTDHATAADRIAGERRHVDREADGALLTPTRGSR